MKRILPIITLILVFSCYGFMFFGGGPDTCSIPGTADVSFETTDGVNILTAAAEGQEFDSGTGGLLARVCVNINVVSAGTLSMRIDDDHDMSAEYIEDLGTSGTLSANGWVCFDSVTNPSISGSTTITIAVMENSGDLKWYIDSNAGYTDGQECTTSDGWVLGTCYNDFDDNFRVYYCD